jgi:hypothetical protein
VFTQTLALLHDAYRELNARKMFWISLIISGVVIAAFALLGVDDKKLYLFGMDMTVPAPRFWYKYIFSFAVIGVWISWGAVALALISTAGTFPELISGGSVDLYLSKPISRLRLFLTKYVGALLFVLLQATVFSIGCYLVFGFRSGQWRASIFLMIPLVTLMFSYLFAVCVFFGVLTRSTIAALLITSLVWLAVAASTRSEQFIFAMRSSTAGEARSFERQARRAEADLAETKRGASLLSAFTFSQPRATRRRDAAKKRGEEARQALAKWTTAHQIARVVTAMMPKTSETIEILDRRIFDDEDLASFRKQMFGSQRDLDTMSDATDASAAAATTAPTTNPADADAAEDRDEWRWRREAHLEGQEAAERDARNRSMAWTLSTSLAFEAVVLAAAAWVFCRRDY